LFDLLFSGNWLTLCFSESLHEIGKLLEINRPRTILINIIEYLFQHQQVRFIRLFLLLNLIKRGQGLDNIDENWFQLIEAKPSILILIDLF
jgi:hypothetical protein